LPTFLRRRAIGSAYRHAFRFTSTTSQSGPSRLDGLGCRLLARHPQEYHRECVDEVARCKHRFVFDPEHNMQEENYQSPYDRIVVDRIVPKEHIGCGLSDYFQQSLLPSPFTNSTIRHNHFDGTARTR
jgi:hypothetical protein